MGVLISGLATAASSAASWAASGVSSLLAGGASGAAGAAASAAPAVIANPFTTGAAAGSAAATAAAPVAAAATEAATGASLYTKLATAASLGSAGAGLIQATKGAPDLPKPAPPPTTPTIADPRVQAAGMDSRQRAAARGGMGFGNTVTNKGGAQGIGATNDLLGKTMLG